MAAAAGTLVAPALVDVEVASAIRREALAGRMDDARAARAIDRLSRAPIERQPHTPLLPRIWELRNHLTAYDAAYVALAEALHAPLLTLDPSLASTRGHDAEIIGI